jgi:hypothetical protein
MVHKTHWYMNTCGWEDPCSFGNQVKHFNLKSTSVEHDKYIGECFSCYSIDNLCAMIDPPSCVQYKPGNVLAVKTLHWDEIFDEDDDDRHRADRNALDGGLSHPGNHNVNDDGKGVVDRQGGEKGTGNGLGTPNGKVKGKATEDGKGIGKLKGKGNGTGAGIVYQTPGGLDISCAVGLQLQKQLSESDLVMKG